MSAVFANATCVLSAMFPAVPALLLPLTPLHNPVTIFAS